MNGCGRAARVQLAAAYGILALVEFLAQMVVAMEARLLPMVTWFWAFVSVTIATLDNVFVVAHVAGAIRASRTQTLDAVPCRTIKA